MGCLDEKIHKNFEQIIKRMDYITDKINSSSQSEYNNAGSEAAGGGGLLDEIQNAGCMNNMNNMNNHNLLEARRMLQAVLLSEDLGLIGHPLEVANEGGKD